MPHPSARARRRDAFIVGAMLAVIAATPAAGSAQTRLPGSPDETRMEAFWRAAVLSPGPYILDFGAAVLDESFNFPEEWTGGKGFGQRMLARVGSGYSSDIVGHGVGAMLGHRVLYEPCGCSGGWRRTWHAFGRGFVTRSDGGAVVPHVSIYVAKGATAGIQAAWYPDSYDTPDMVREFSLGVVVNALLNIGREFSPELRRLMPGF
jgi:hypothetical protein